MKHLNVFAVAVSLISVLGFISCAGSAHNDSDTTLNVDRGGAATAVAPAVLAPAPALTPIPGNANAYYPQNNYVTATTTVGGRGGNGFGEAAAAGYTLYGLQIYSDGIVERISPVWGSNYGNVPNYYSGGLYGKPTGAYSYLSCPGNNSRVIGIFGRSGSFVDQIGIICKPQDGSSTTAYYSSTAGGAGGSPYQITCPSGTFAMGIYGRSGSGLDQIGLTCQ